MANSPLGSLGPLAELPLGQQSLWDDHPSALPSGPATAPNLADYDRIIVAFSGGADSQACVLHLLESGVEASRIHLHHHLVDGDGETFMDWPCTEAYCRAFAQAMGMQFSTSFRVGGFEREMTRTTCPTAPSSVPFEETRKLIGGAGPEGTRLKFPQQSASLKTRWCSAALKIGVFDGWVNNDPQFLHGKTLVVTGERAEESASRAKYNDFEPHRADNRNGKYVKRYVDHWRPVHKWLKPKVWAIIERFPVVAHPCYFLNFGRCSCIACVFGGPDQWASVKVIVPKQFTKIAAYEKTFGVTIHRAKPVEQLVSEGTPYDMDPFWLQAARSTEWTLPIITDNWKLPPGAYGDQACGPS